MPPKEETPLLSNDEVHSGMKPAMLRERSSSVFADGQTEQSKRNVCKLVILLSVLGVLGAVLVARNTQRPQALPTGSYKLLQCQEGEDFFKYYTFYDGADSLGSAGHNIYVSKPRATELGIAKSIPDPVTGKDAVYMASAKTGTGPRESVRLEGTRRFNHGLFIMDLDHMPAGCGVWPAFWLTDEANWPRNGEIDIVEGINRQPMVKTALHTSDQCSMYAHVPFYEWTGKWDTATGIFDTWSGQPNYVTRVEADNCWVMAPHQWANQGCVAVDQRNNTLGAPLNEAGGGVYALEWDPVNRRIRSWAFPRSEGIPRNLQDALDTASLDPTERVEPDTDDWGLPYAFFAIGETTGCSADHFKDMRVVINLAFCGTVAGNRFFQDCPELAKLNLTGPEHRNDPWQTCNAYIESNPKALEEAYWKIRGAYVYQRTD